MAGQSSPMATERREDATGAGGGRNPFRLDLYKRGQGTPFRAFVLGAMALLLLSGARWLYLLPPTGSAWFHPIWVSGGTLLGLAIAIAAGVFLYRGVIHQKSDHEFLRWGALTGGLALAGVVAWLVVTKALGTVEALARPIIADPVPTSWGVVISCAVFCYGIWVVYRLLVNHPQRTDFLIETETELRKVAWPTRREYMGASVVVIVIVAALSLYLTGVDMLLNKLMTWLRIGY